MKSFFDTLPNESQILGDLAMIVANPYTTNTLIRNIFTALVEVVKKRAFPKVNLSQPVTNFVRTMKI